MFQRWINYVIERFHIGRRQRRNRVKRERERRAALTAKNCITKRLWQSIIFQLFAQQQPSASYWIFVVFAVSEVVWWLSFSRNVTMESNAGQNVFERVGVMKAHSWRLVKRVTIGELANKCNEGRAAMNTNWIFCVWFRFGQSVRPTDKHSIRSRQFLRVPN